MKLGYSVSSWNVRKTTIKVKGIHIINHWLGKLVPLLWMKSFWKFVDDYTTWACTWCIPVISRLGKGVLKALLKTIKKKNKLMAMAVFQWTSWKQMAAIGPLSLPTPAMQDFLERFRGSCTIYLSNFIITIFNF